MKKGLSHIVFVLDRSGSMQSMQEEAVVSYNKFIEEQKGVPGEATFHFILFSTDIVDQFQGNLRDAPELTVERYNPKNGTKLYDAMAYAIDVTGKAIAFMPEDQRPEKVIVTTMTDGEENSSVRCGQQQLAAMIKHQTEKYNWDFIFLGANFDTHAVAMNLNIQPANTFDWSNVSPETTRQGFALNSQTVTRSRTSVRSQ